MSRGWIKLHRMDLESSFYRLSPIAKCVWLELLLWADSATGITTISQRHLADRAGVDREACRRALERLQNLKMVEKVHPPPAPRSAPTDTSYKITNWHKFQVDAKSAAPTPAPTKPTIEQEVASSTKKRAAPGGPGASPFPPAFWRVLKHYACPPLDRADKGQLLQRLKAGESLEDLTAKLVVGFAYGAKTGRGALGFTRQFNDPMTRLEMDDVRKNFRLAAADDRPGDGSGRRAGDPAAELPSQPRLPALGTPDTSSVGNLLGARRETGPVQDDLGVDDGGESRALWEASLLDRAGDASRADGSDAGLAASSHPTQEAGGRVEAGGFLDLV